MENECSWYDVSCGLSWLADELKSIVVWMYDGILQGVASLFAAIPVPDFMLNVQPFTFPPMVSYMVDLMMIPQGMVIIVSAYVARFILRRIPIIG